MSKTRRASTRRGRAGRRDLAAAKQSSSRCSTKTRRDVVVDARRSPSASCRALTSARCVESRARARRTRRTAGCRTWSMSTPRVRVARRSRAAASSRSRRRACEQRRGRRPRSATASASTRVGGGGAVHVERGLDRAPPRAPRSQGARPPAAVLRESYARACSARAPPPRRSPRALDSPRRGPIQSAARRACGAAAAGTNQRWRAKSSGSARACRRALARGGCAVVARRRRTGAHMPSGARALAGCRGGRARGTTRLVALTG